MSTRTLKRVAESDADTETVLVVVPEGKTAQDLFQMKDTTGLDPILAKLRAQIDLFAALGHTADTPDGRDAIRSFAARITKAKTALERAGKAVADEVKKLPKQVDANRNHVTNTVEAWRDEFRKPLTDWEEAEAARKDRIETNLRELEGTINDPFWTTRHLEVLRERLSEVELDPITPELYGEYEDAARELTATAIATLKDRIAQTEKRDAEAAELARLRAETAERDRKDREAKVAQEAADKARADAEAAVAAERLASARREEEAKAVAKAAQEAQAEAEARAAAAEQEAAQRAAKAAQEATEKAARDAQAAKDAEDAERQRREQDRTHKAAINLAAMMAFINEGLSAEAAKAAVIAIATGKVPAVSISY